MYLHFDIFNIVQKVDELLAGRDDKFKGGTVTIEPSNAAGGGGSSGLGSGMATPKFTPKAKAATVANYVPTNSHLDAVPQASPINRNRVVHKKVRTFPLCFDDTDPSAVHDNANQQETLVPIRYYVPTYIIVARVLEASPWAKKITLLIEFT